MARPDEDFDDRVDHDAREEFAYCSGPGHDEPRPADKDGLCWGHRKQKQRGKPMTPLLPHRGGPHGLGYSSLKERVLEASIDLANADAEDPAAFDRAWARIRKAFRVMMCARCSRSARCRTCRRGPVWALRSGRQNRVPQPRKD